MSTSTEWEEEDIYDVQPTNILSVQRMKEVFSQNEEIGKSKLPVKPPKPVGPVKKNPVVPTKPTLNNNTSEDAPVLPNKLGNKVIEKINNVTPNRISNILNNPFLQQDQNRGQNSPNSKPPITPKTWKRPETPPKVTTKNIEVSKDTSDVSGENSEQPAFDNQTLPLKTGKLFPRATQNKNVLSDLENGKSDRNNNNKSAETMDSVVARTKPAVVSKSMKRVTTIKRKSFKRLIDGITFTQIPFVKLNLSGAPPAKPEKVKNLDLSKVVAEYEKQLSMVGDAGGYDEDEIYEDVGISSPQERAISLIQPMRESEEWPESDPEDLYDDTAVMTPRVPPPIHGDVNDIDVEGPDPSEDYDELMGRDSLLDVDDEPDEMYDVVDLPEGVAKTETETKTQGKETSQTKVIVEDEISDKERKKREKDEKERQKKELKRKEKEMKEIKSKFKIDLSILKNVHPAGRIKANAKGGKMDLVVVAGQLVNIIRMSKPNPIGKWLIQLQGEETVGYVTSDNVEVETSNIRGVMQGSFENINQAGTGSDVTGNCNDAIAEDLYEAVSP